MLQIERRPSYVGADFHSHNVFSPDSCARPEQVVRRCQKTGINCLAVTNHNTIRGALETQEVARELGVDLLVIPGEEITLDDRNPWGANIELLAFFLEETIGPGLTMSEVLREIKKQGGFLGIPHIFDEKRHGAGEERGVEIIRQAKELGIPVCVEVYNCRASSSHNRQAEDFLQSRNKLHRDDLLTIVGSDAHHPQEIGRTKLLSLKPWRTQEEFLRNLVDASSWVKRHSPVYGWRRDSATSYYRVLNRLLWIVNKKILKRLSPNTNEG